MSNTATAKSVTDTSIGSVLQTARIDYFNGYIGEILAFNRALSAQEVRNYFELTRYRYGV